MKKALVYLFALLLCLLFTQCKSKEDKANALIDEYMFKNLYDYESYQPIETRIDSAFYTVYNDSTALRHACFILFSQKDHKKLQTEYDRIKSSVDIWCDGHYYSSYSYNKCQDCLNEAKENLVKQFFFLSRIDMYTDSLISLADTLNKEFIGWEVTHDFRCKTKGGSSDIGHYVFVMDKDFKTILSQSDPENEDRKRINAIIKECLEMTDEERNEMKEMLRNSQLNI